MTHEIKKIYGFNINAPYIMSVAQRKWRELSINRLNSRWHFPSFHQSGDKNPKVKKKIMLKINQFLQLQAGD